MTYDGEFIDRRLGLYEQYLEAEREAIEKYDSEPYVFQQQALDEAIDAGMHVRIPLSGMFDVANNIVVVAVTETESRDPVPEGCISKKDLVKIAHEYGVDSRAIGTAWTRLVQRVAHSIDFAEEGISYADSERIEDLKQSGIRIYQHEWSWGKTGLYFYTFRDNQDKDLEIFRLPDGIEDDTPYSNANDKYLVSDNFIKAVDQGLLEQIEGDKVIYPYGLGPKYKRLFYGLADQLRSGFSQEQETADELTLGYATIDEFKDFAEQNAMNQKLVMRIERAVRLITNDEGMVSRYVIEHGEAPTGYRDFLDSDMTFGGLSKNEVADVELLTSDGKVNLDTLKAMCYRGSFKKLASNTFSYGDKTDAIVWGLIEQKRKEALETLNQQPIQTT